jgi:hypothetical protein
MITKLNFIEYFSVTAHLKPTTAGNGINTVKRRTFLQLT